MSEELNPCNQTNWCCDCEQCNKYWQWVESDLQPDPPIGDIDNVAFDWDNIY